MLRSLLAIITVACYIFGIPEAQAQCPGCIPDITCTISPAFPTMCPAQPPAATVGEEYVADFTFWMPAEFSDPGSGVTVSFQQMTVTGISGLPFGLDMETSDPAGVYFPQQNEFGCARLCGTPLTAGLYNIVVDILASVELGGFTTQVPEQFVLLLNVLPGSGGNTSFSFDPSSGCGSVTANFQALIDGSPSPTSYSWDFGNGNTSDQQLPPPQIYDQPGEYVIALQTSIGGQVLNSVSINGVNDNWCGDVEEPNIPLVGCSGSPDLYFVLTDADGATYGSSTFDDTFAADWTGLALSLSNPPYSLAFYDEDPISQHDHLGTYNIPMEGEGTQYINVAGGTTGSLTISLETQQVFTDTDTLVVHPSPEVSIEQTEDQLCNTDTLLIGEIWLLDGDTVAMNTTCIDAMGPGTYQLITCNSYGCAGISGTLVICPELEITLTENVLSVPGGFQSYSWSLNGAPIPGANNSFIIIQQAGNYAVTVNAGEDCIVTASIDLVTRLEDLAAFDQRLHIYPNPNSGSFTVEVNGSFEGRSRLAIHDITGRRVHEEWVFISSDHSRIALALELSSGTYSITIEAGDRTLKGKFILQ